MIIVAYWRLLTILQYDYNKVSVMRKVFSHYSKYTRTIIKEQTKVART